ncbi:MAG: long-chain fatty acid--CoA ligase [Pseudooceanicola nanhaiensis]|uniref:long-chain fatty acid--CoA ligase n=1 Tax=Pseudooceanicola nanhaiensis TaxID=375761 RepID=UPI00405967B2
MRGLMQDRPLLISSLIEHASRYHSEAEIVTRTCEGPVVRHSYAGIADRAKKIAQALLDLGVRPGDRVATLAWNTHRHLELYFAVSGIGAVLHTVNPRLFPDQISYILNHAEARVLMFDITFAGLVTELGDGLHSVETRIAMTDAAHMAEMPAASLCYETILGAQDATYDWPDFDETAASSLCYTSGTTGNPKGVLYSHRSTLLHSMMLCQVDGMALSSRDSTLLCVPLFHVNGWGIPYASAMCGAKLVLPGPNLDGASLYELAATEGCTFSLGVPTVWFGFLDHAETRDPETELSLERVIVGGSSAPRALMRRLSAIGVHGFQAWGMSETSPVATVGNLLPKHAALDDDARVEMQCVGGRPVFGVELRHIDDDGALVPMDGRTPGELQIRGHWVTSGYYGQAGTGPDAEGWFDTGDIATLDGDGYVRITDRSKDVIKSGGEWISSIDLENAAMAHPDVAEAAVIGLSHPKWQERPLLIVVLRKGASPDPAGLRDFLAGHVAKWWLPDDIAYVDAIPHTATGKIQKTELRKQFADHFLPETA